VSKSHAHETNRVLSITDSEGNHPQSPLDEVRQRPPEHVGILCRALLGTEDLPRADLPNYECNQYLLTLMAGQDSVAPSAFA
jgi:hypothetical protein